MDWEKIGYAAACVLVPAAWGLLVYGLSNLIEARVRKSERKRGKDDDAALPPLDYHI